MLRCYCCCRNVERIINHIKNSVLSLIKSDKEPNGRIKKVLVIWKQIALLVVHQFKIKMRKDGKIICSNESKCVENGHDNRELILRDMRALRHYCIIANPRRNPLIDLEIFTRHIEDWGLPNLHLVRVVLSRTVWFVHGDFLFYLCEQAFPLFFFF